MHGLKVRCIRKITSILFNVLGLIKAQLGSVSLPPPPIFFLRLALAMLYLCTESMKRTTAINLDRLSETQELVLLREINSLCWVIGSHYSRRLSAMNRPEETQSGNRPDGIVSSGAGESGSGGRPVAMPVLNSRAIRT